MILYVIAFGLGLSLIVSLIVGAFLDEGSDGEAPE